MTAADRLQRTNAKALRRFGALHRLGGNPVQGLFAQPGKLFILSDGVEMAARVPMLVVADGDVPVNPVGLAALCQPDVGNEQAYTVREALPDGLGLTVLELEKVLA